MSDAFLITGFPGFIASRLVTRLLPQGRRIFLLSEERFAAAAQEKAQALASDAGQPADQVQVVTGDITRPDLGLGAADLERLRSEVNEVYHLAAIYDLAVPEEIARKVNVMGTSKVLRFIQDAGPGRMRHNYISTCYVAGTRQGMIFENELDRGQAFKNHYESTKFAAEVLVERSKGEIETRVLRPAIVIGDSRSGETQKFDGPYPSFGAIMMGALVALPGPGRAPVNLVPVDFVVEALATIPRQPDTAGKTFQLADPNPLTSRQLVELAADRLGAPRPRFQVPERLMHGLLRLGPVSRMTGITPEALAYFNHSQVFDTTNTRLGLAGTGVSCPPLPSYINQILRYYRERAQLPWRFDAPA